MNISKRCSVILAIAFSCFKGFAMENEEKLQVFPFTSQDYDAVVSELTDANPSVDSMMAYMPDEEIELGVYALDEKSRIDSLESLKASRQELISTIEKAERPQYLEFYSPEQKVKRGMMRSSLGVTADEFEGKQVCKALEKEYKKLSKMEKEKKNKKTRITPSSKKKHSKSLSQFSFGTINE